MIDWNLKLKALLHDPPHKQWVISIGSNKNARELLKLDTHSCPDGNYHRNTHEVLAERLLDCVCSDECIDEPEELAEKIKNADYISYPMNRVLLKFDENARNPTVRGDNIYFFDMFNENEIYDVLKRISESEHNKVKKLFKRIGEIPFGDRSQKMRFAFLFLWRFYPQIFPWMYTHPADSRTPNHSIYDHIVQVSSLASALPKPAFLLYTISPVQSFISTARKTQDLWAGSYLLSYLTWKSIELLIEELGPDAVIYPNLLGQPLMDKWFKEQKFNVGGIDKDFGRITEEYLEMFLKTKENLFDDSIEKITIANLPNRFLAIIPHEKKYIAEKCEKAFESELTNLAKRVTEKLCQLTEEADKEKKIKMERQVEGHLKSYFQVYWAVLPWMSGDINLNDKSVCNDALDEYCEVIGEDELYSLVKMIIRYSAFRKSKARLSDIGHAYPLLIKLTERLLGARKSVRDLKISQKHNKPAGICHLCGENEIIDANWEALGNKHPGIIREKEKICGVCLTKRLFPRVFADIFGVVEQCEEIRFPSTSEMAAVTTKKTIANPREFRYKFNGFDNKIKAKNNGKGIPSGNSVPALKDSPLNEIDGQWLMQESYRKEYFKNEYGLNVDEKDYDDIVKFLNQNNIDANRYYAVLQMDGDHMGQWLAGKMNPEIEKTIHTRLRQLLIAESKNIKDTKDILHQKHPITPSLHQTISRKLGFFALEKVRGIVENDHWGKLIYAGGDDVLAFLPAVEALDCAFCLQEEFKKILGSKASMSAGIVIVHHKFPLSIALTEANEAEKMAKNHYKRDAFCIKLITRSAEERVSGGKWEMYNFMNDLINVFKNDQLSSSVCSDLLRIVEDLTDENSQEKSKLLTDILGSEIKRILSRKKSKDKENMLTKEFIKTIIDEFTRYEFGYREFANLFAIAGFIA
ncbi:MAG: type III-B CRISPR-associated protein Cas10/Cmr2 [Tepidanaerobacteraceae bacterium]|nr:type III-B CRISPR-associated protein Cas10/Cmr2 [Tepidanaerobacteraceae bacterium]